MDKPKYISVNGELVPYAHATTHLLTPAVKYGALVFEGLRAYWNGEQEELYIFRLGAHLKRFTRTLRAVGFDAVYDTADLTEMAREVLKANEVRDDVHMRISAYIEGSGLYDARGPVSIMCAAYGRASGPIETKLTRASVVSWRRIADASMPPRLKVAANYHNARLGALEAKSRGFDEPIFLTEAGHIAEGAGSCMMMVRDGQLVTPAVTDGILESVTRRTLLELARDMALPFVERSIDRTELFFCDEVFFCGTGVEILPISCIDTLNFNTVPGPVTAALWAEYERVVRGNTDAYEAWRTPVYLKA